MRNRYVLRFDRSVMALVIIGVLASVAGCSESARAPTSVPSSIPIGTAALKAAVISSAQDPPLIMAGSGEVAFVSLKVGSFPNAQLAVLRNLKRASEQTSLMMDGGLDPVAIGAEVGDTLVIRLEGAMGLEASGTGVVPPALKPTVIRTIPSRGKKDVPLNTQIVIVFSEPIQPPTASGIQLLRGDVPVPAQVTVSSDALRAAVEPNEPLAPSTAYTLVVPAGVADLNGQQLGEAVQVDFTTVTAGQAAIPLVTLFGNVAAVEAGAFMSCALTTARDAYCWGANGDGRLGNGSTMPSMVPTAVAGGLKFMKLSAGTHGCAVSPDGTSIDGRVYCWGYNLFGEVVSDARHRSQLGATNVEPEGPGPFREVSAGGLTHSCALEFNRIALCWGSNDYGQLGAETTDGVGSMRPSLGHLNKISAGEYRTCAVTVDGVGYCWGDNSRGQVGDGTTVNRFVPTPVLGGLHFVSISPGGPTHTCGLTTSGAAYCWGSNVLGKLGDGTTTDRLTPAAVAGGLVFTALSVGAGNQTCGLTASGAAYCWGINDDGQLGDGTTITRASPTAVAGGLAFVQLSTGTGHTCGVTVDGIAYCWGNNANGQLGDGGTTPRLVPTAVVAPR
jgi:alpha-tubulin suppressor-like RCC1 family protein